MSSGVLIFDLDGTISNPLEGIWGSINFALESFDYGTITREEVAQHIGPPLDETFVSITGSSDEEMVSGLVNRYRERFSQVGYRQNELYEGISEALASLAERNVLMGICTSKRTDFAEKIITMFQLDEYFSFVSGGDIGVKKAHQIKDLLREKHIDHSAIMIGDRAVDILSARQNNIQSAGVLWGFGSREELAKQQPKYLLNKPEELHVLIET